MSFESEPAADATLEAQAKALASPLRMRILRLCLHEARTNKELADALDLNPGSMLHHVRSLADTGFLRALEPRVGARGAREVPYLATRLSWRTPAPGMSPVLIQTFLQEIDGLSPTDLDVARLGLKLNRAHLAEFRQRLHNLLEEFAALPADEDGEPISLLTAIHPDRQNRP